jgi:predicted MFS family arabinose efflux permease
LPYGAYRSYLAIVAVLASLILGKISDRNKKRAQFLYPSTIFTAISIILFAFAKDLHFWAIASGLFSFTSSIGAVFVTTTVLDHASGVKEGMVAREFLLGGRTDDWFNFLPDSIHL